MRALTLVILMLLLVNCRVTSRKKTAFVTGGGSFISTIDSSLKKDVGIVQINATSVAVTFPAKFAQKSFGDSPWAKDKSFFTPDTGIIRRVDTAINLQYCEAIDKYYKSKHGSLSTEVFCKLWKAQSPYFNKQYIGYTGNNGEKILHIKLIDFREDPHNLKQYFTSSWIDGWHEWYYSNVKLLEYNLDKNQLIISSM